MSFLGANQVVSLTALTADRLYLIFGGHLVGGDAALDSLFDGRVGQVVAFYLAEVVLLGAEHGSRARYSSPANKHLGRNLIVLHAVNADECSGASEAGFAVDGDGA